MCGSNNNEKFTVKWQKELPDSEGEWFWIEQWSCGCVHKSGIVWVILDDENNIHNTEGLVQLPNNFFLSWEGSKYHDGQTIKDINAWAKISLPPNEWCE